MKKIIHLPSFLVFVGISFFLAWILNKFFDLSFWVLLFLVVLGIGINGIIIMFSENNDAHNKDQRE